MNNKCLVTLYFKVQFFLLLILSAVVVKFRHWVGLGTKNMLAQNIKMLINYQYVNNTHANKQLVTSENCPYTEV